MDALVALTGERPATLQRARHRFCVLLLLLLFVFIVLPGQYNLNNELTVWQTAV